MPQKSPKTPGMKARGRDGSEWHFSLVIAQHAPSAEQEFAKQLRKAIEASGVSQYHLAKATGVPQGAISQFLAGKDLRLNTFTRLARVMGMTLELNPAAGPTRLS
jgi:predicted XRE-type DNA-binding protein